MKYKKVLLPTTLLLAVGVCGGFASIEKKPLLEKPIALANSLDNKGLESIVKTTYKVEMSHNEEENVNVVRIGDNIYVYFDSDTSKFLGIGTNYGDMQMLNETERMHYKQNRNQLVLSEVEKLFGSDSVEFQNVFKAIGDKKKISVAEATVYDEETNTVYIGDKVTVNFEIETDKFVGTSFDLSHYGVDSLSKEEWEYEKQQRDSLILSEIQKLFGRDSEKFKSVFRVLGNQQEISVIDSILEPDYKVEMNYNEEENVNVVRIGNNISVYFDSNTIEFLGFGIQYGDLDMQSLSEVEREEFKVERNQLVLSEIEKLLGSNSAEYQNLIKAIK